MLSTKTIREVWAPFGGHCSWRKICHVGVQKSPPKKSCKLGLDEFGPPAQCSPVFSKIFCRVFAFQYVENFNFVKMKVLSLNFVNCAAKACKATSESFPLHPKDAELVQDEIELNPAMLINVLPRLDWAALRTTSSEVRIIVP